MTISSLVAALAIGTAIGVGGRWLVPVGRALPWWLTPTVGVAAAALATISARLAGIDSTRVSVVEIVLQVTFAGLAVAVVAGTADQQPRERPYHRTGPPR